jgi:4-amino-4-deoxy-L-arabinose transferase-like glycosyltransferase
VLLSFLVLLAFTLRVYQLDHFGFWQDEGLTPLRSSYPVQEILSNRIVIQEAITRDTHPPLYYLIIHFTRALLGESDFAYRYPSVLFGVLLVPLLFQLGRRLGGPTVGFVAAMLVAVNPLQIWYAQEARMYTLLALLGALATYIVWRSLTTPALSNRALAARLGLYFLCAGLAIYTHYTAFFLVGVQLLFWAWLLWRRGERRLILGTAVAGSFIALPLVPYTVPRLFTGAEANYYYVPPWIMLQDVVHGFGLGMTVDFGQWEIRLLDLGLAGLLLLGLFAFRSAKQHDALSRIFLLSYLLAAVMGLMLGSLLLKPMYMGVRHIMIGSPAIFLLAGQGLLALPQRPRQLALLLGVLLLLVGPAVSLHNLYYNPVYAKDDVRALIATIEQRAGSNDVVLYNNAILMALHWHYGERPDLPVTALPVYPYAGGPDTLAQLEALAGQYGRIWYVTDPPADGRDDAGLVAGWLAQHAVVVERRHAHARTMIVEGVAYQTGSHRLEALPPDALPVEMAWDGLPALRGLRADFAQPAQLPTLWLELFWEGVRAPSPGRQIQLALRDAAGNLWLQSSHPLLPEGEAAAAWAEGELMRRSYGLAVPAGMPPGSYDLLLKPGHSAGGSEGEWQEGPALHLDSSAAWPVAARVPAPEFGHLSFANGMKLLGIATPDRSVRPGHPLPVSIYWQQSRGTPAPGLRYELEVVNGRGEVVRTQGGNVGPAWLAANDWPAGAFILQHTGLYFPPLTTPGTYRLRWRLLDGDHTVPGRPQWRPWSTETIAYGSVRVEAWPKETAVPSAATVVEAAFGPAISLYGYDLEKRAAAAGEALDLTLYWRAQQAPDHDYLVFVHLVADGDDQPVQQIDRIPVDWLRPTQGWRAGEVLTDRYLLTLPPELPAGLYRLVVGLYQPESWERLPVTYQGQAQPHDQLLLTTLRLP